MCHKTVRGPIEVVEDELASALAARQIRSVAAPVFLRSRCQKIMTAANWFLLRLRRSAPLASTSFRLFLRHLLFLLLELLSFTYTFYYFYYPHYYDRFILMMGALGDQPHTAYLFVISWRPSRPLQYLPTSHCQSESKNIIDKMSIPTRISNFHSSLKRTKSIPLPNHVSHKHILLILLNNWHDLLWAISLIVFKR